MIGIFADSQGDLEAFAAAWRLLRDKGARRFIFAGGRYSDLDEWIQGEKDRLRGQSAYSDQDFLTDITNFLQAKEQLDRPPAFSEGDPVEEENLDKIKARFVRVPDKASLEYREDSVPRLAVDMLGDALCCIVHDKNDLTRDDLLNATVFIHGKGPEPKVVQIGPRFFVTPGMLTGPGAHTCALIWTDDRNLRFSAFRLDGKVVVDGQLLVLDRRTKMSVK